MKKRNSSFLIYHYNQRSMVERVNKYLKEEKRITDLMSVRVSQFGCNTIYYQGANKVASVFIKA